MADTEGAVVEAPAAEPVVTTKKKKVETTGNLILDIAHEVAGLTKTGALKLAVSLSNNIETDYFRLGGVLKLIGDNSWYEGFATFDDFVYEKFGFQARKARYLINIYENLVTKMIPWDKVGHLGWTKLKDLAPIITPDNVDEWVQKAEGCTVVELQALIKAQKPSEDGEKTEKTTDDVVTLKFKLKADQAETVSLALAKAKGEMHTEYDNVAFEGICSGYLGDVSKVQKPFDLDEVINAVGWEKVLQRIADQHPEYDIKVDPASVDEDAAAPATEG